jgi:hypothetical protein
MDWTTEAAIRALTYLGCQYEPIAPDIHEAFQLLTVPTWATGNGKKRSIPAGSNYLTCSRRSGRNARYPGPDEGPR